MQGRDRTDEIRATLGEARRKGQAVKLRYAYDLLASDGNAPLARAIVGDVLRELEPSATAAPREF
jgi:hypothetical protein